MKKIYNLIIKLTYAILNLYSSNTNFKNIIFKSYSRIKAFENQAKYDKIFKKRKLIYDDKYSFYKIDPFPEKKFFDDYYNDCFPSVMGFSRQMIKERDIEHFELINKKIYKDVNKKQNILNFGSGNGGISLLLRSKDFKVFNFDYSEPSEIGFKEDYHFINDFNQIKEDIKFDLIYSSHSLEHVIDIKDTLNKFKKFSHSKTLYFFEVPNGYDQNYIRPPHTYYFTKNFFKKIFKKTNEESFFECQLYIEKKYINNDKKGGVIKLFTNYEINI